MPDLDKNQFVVLYHQMPSECDRGDHWDLMLRDDEQLLTWALQSPPRIGIKIQATQLANHRLHYLQYEGLIDRNRGTVSRVLQGTYAWQRRDDEIWQARLRGKDINWNLSITRSHDQRFCVEFSD